MLKETLRKSSNPLVAQINFSGLAGNGNLGVLFDDFPVSVNPKWCGSYNADGFCLVAVNAWEDIMLSEESSGKSKQN